MDRIIIIVALTALALGTLALLAAFGCLVCLAPYVKVPSSWPNWAPGGRYPIPWSDDDFTDPVAGKPIRNALLICLGIFLAFAAIFAVLIAQVPDFDF